MLLTAQQKESQEFAANTHELKDLRLKAIMKQSKMSFSTNTTLTHCLSASP